MRLLLYVVAILCMPVAVAAADLAKGFGRGDDPAWVDRIALPNAATEDLSRLRAEVEGGVFAQMVDSQVAWEAGRKISYFRYAQTVTDRAGLEGTATLDLNFDPSFENLVLTHLDLVRDGKVTSYRDTVQEEVFRRETRLDAGIIDGSLTVVLRIPGLKVGDTLDYSVTRMTEPLFEGTDRSDLVWMEYSVPVVMTRHIVNWPKDWPFVMQAVPEGISHSRQDMGPVVRHELRREIGDAIRVEDRSPVETDSFAVVEYGDRRDWSGLVAALIGHYGRDYQLGAEWQAKTDAIARAHGRPAERAIAALRMVQEEISYVGLEVGAGGYLARAPDLVAAQGFGDCKDKALLLHTMLKRLGVVSAVALTDLDSGYALPKRLPGLGAFDHMIVRATIEGRDYWMDPTQTHQGGSLETAVAPDYGYALPITADDTVGLVPIPMTDAMGWVSDTVEAYSFSLLGVALSVTTTYRGAAADSWRYDWATQPHGDIGDNFLRFYNRTYPGIVVVQPVALSDDRNRNVVVVDERYMIPAPAMFRNGLREDFEFGAEDYARYLRDGVTGFRRAPLLIGTARHNTHRVEIARPPHAMTPPEPVRISNPAFDFSFGSRENDQGGITMDWAFRTKARTVAAAEVPAILSDAQSLSEKVAYTWDMSP